MKRPKLEHHSSPAEPRRRPRGKRGDARSIHSPGSTKKLAQGCRDPVRMLNLSRMAATGQDHQPPAMQTIHGRPSLPDRENQVLISPQHEYRLGQAVKLIEQDFGFGIGGDERTQGGFQVRAVQRLSIRLEPLVLPRVHRRVSAETKLAPHP
jgi:hypothetical protein